MAYIYSNGQLMYIINMTQNVKYTTDNSNATITVSANLKARMNIIIGVKIYINNNIGLRQILFKTVSTNIFNDPIFSFYNFFK